MNNLSAGQRVLRAAGLSIMLMTVAVCALLAVTYVTGEQIHGWRLPLVVLSLLLAAVAALAMIVDTFDLWMLGRRMTALSVRMFHSLVFVSVLAAFALSIATKTPGLLLVMAPSLFIYLITVMRPQPAGGFAAGSSGRARAAGTGRQPRAGGGGRQKRGGKKRR